MQPFNQAVNFCKSMFYLSAYIKTLMQERKKFKSNNKNFKMLTFWAKQQIFNTVAKISSTYPHKET